MRVLLTGAAGFIGTAVDRTLVEAGHEVERVDLMLTEAHVAATAPAGVRHLDVRDAPAWIGRLSEVDVVCHQAALVGLGARVADFPSYASHNDVGTAALLAAMHDAGVRHLVLASSMVVYGEGRYICPAHGPTLPGVRTEADLRAGRFDHRCPVCDDPLAWSPVGEDAPLDPRSAYAASKVAQEHYARAWARQTGGSVVALRYHNVYGPGMPRDTPYSGVAAMFRSAVARGDPPRVFEDGGQMRDFVHVDDVARANLLAVEQVGERAPTSFAAYNVASGVPTSILGVATHVADGAADAESGAAPLVTREFRLGDVRHVVASPERARRDLGFVAAVAPEQGLARFAREPLRA